MSEYEPGLEIVEDDPLAGPADIVDELEGEGDDATAAKLKARMKKSGRAVPRARGFSDSFQKLTAGLRGRKFISDLGTAEVRVDWMAFHVPPGGAASLSLQKSSSRTGGVKLKFMGLGFGAGRKISLSEEQDFGKRDSCFWLGLDLEVRLRTFASDGGSIADQVQVDVNGSRGSYIHTPDICPHCFTVPRRPPPRARATGRRWDLTDDKNGLTEKDSREFTRESEIEIGLDISLPGLDKLSPALTFSREGSSKWVAAYEFPGEACFTAYDIVGRRSDFPHWGRS